MKAEKGFAIFGVTMLLLLLVPFSAILNGFVLTKIWNWFMPHFGVVETTLPVSIGISSIPSLFRNTRLQEKKLKTSEIISGVFIGPLVVLLFSWIVTFFM